MNFVIVECPDEFGVCAVSENPIKAIEYARVACETIANDWYRGLKQADPDIEHPKPEIVEDFTTGDNGEFTFEIEVPCVDYKMVVHGGGGKVREIR